MMRHVCISGFIFLLVALLAGCASSRRSEPLGAPLDSTSATLIHGQQVFMEHCNKCHPHGESGIGPSLANKGILPNFLIRFQIRNGLGVMPSFPKSTLPQDDMDALIEYIDALQKSKNEH